MDAAAKEEEHNKLKLIKKKENWRNRNTKVSFSAVLPEDVVDGVYADTSICAVMFSTNPFFDMRESILEMIREVGVRDWNEMEELVYCYIALNSTDVHRFVEEAFLSLCL